MSDKTPEPREFCWNELVTGDVGKAKSFYADLMGWETHDMPFGDMTYHVFKNGDKDIAGLMEMPADAAQMGVPPHWMSYIAVEDIAATLAKATELGGTVLVPEMPVGDVGKLGVIQDPTGAHIAFWQKVGES